MTLEREAGDMKDSCVCPNRAGGGEQVSRWSEQAHVPNTDGRKNCGGLRSHRVPSLCGELNQATAHPSCAKEAISHFWGNLLSIPQRHSMGRVKGGGGINLLLKVLACDLCWTKSWEGFSVFITRLWPGV